MDAARCNQEQAYFEESWTASNEPLEEDLAAVREKPAGRSGGRRRSQEILAPMRRRSPSSPTPQRFVPRVSPARQDALSSHTGDSKRKRRYPRRSP